MDDYPFKYSVRLLGLDKRLNDAGPDGQLCEPSQWCVDNVGLNGHAWKRLTTYNPYVRKGMVFYYFRRQEDAAMFKLAFGDY